jgi:hypothetical protein
VSCAKVPAKIAVPTYLTESARHGKIAKNPTKGVSTMDAGNDSNRIDWWDFAQKLTAVQLEDAVREAHPESIQNLMQPEAPADDSGAGCHEHLRILYLQVLSTTIEAMLEVGISEEQIIQMVKHTAVLKRHKESD